MQLLSGYQNSRFPYVALTNLCLLKPLSNTLASLFSAYTMLASPCHSKNVFRMTAKPSLQVPKNSEFFPQSLALKSNPFKGSTLDDPK